MLHCEALRAWSGFRLNPKWEMSGKTLSLAGFEAPRGTVRLKVQR